MQSHLLRLSAGSSPHQQVLILTYLKYRPADVKLLILAARAGRAERGKKEKFFTVGPTALQGIDLLVFKVFW